MSEMSGEARDIDKGTSEGFECGESNIKTAPAAPFPTLTSLMAGYDGPKPELIDLGKSMGRELW